MLLVLAFPASSLTVKYCPLEKSDAAGNLISSAEEAETPRICDETEEVIVDVTAVLP